MIDSVTDYMHFLANTIIFASAISLFLLFAQLLSYGNSTQADTMKFKASVGLEDSTSYAEDIVTVKGSNVIADILSQQPDVDIFVENIQIDTDSLELMRMNNKTSLDNLYSTVDKNATYIVKCLYDNNNILTGVNYVKN